MTRINCVDPSTLTDLALGAEYRELPRVFKLVRLAIVRGETPETVGIPPKYTMGKGHVKFFYNKLGWLVHRYQTLVVECRHRGRRVNFPDLEYLIDGIPEAWMGGWHPTKEAKTLNLKRLKERKAIK